LSSGGQSSRGSSFKVGTPPKSSASSGPSKPSSFSTGTIKTQKPFTKTTPTPTRTIVFKTAPVPVKEKKPGIWSPVNYGKPTPYVAPKPKVKAGTYVTPKSSKSSGGSSGGGGPKIGTFHPDSTNKAMMAPGGGKLRSKNIGTGGKVTY
jgi:hypothetical protein